MKVLDDILKEQRKVKRQDVDNVIETIFKFIRVSKKDTNKQSISAKAEVLDDFIEILNTSYISSSDWSKKEKAQALDLMDSLNSLKDKFDLYLSNTSKKDIEAAGKRMHKKVQSSFK